MRRGRLAGTGLQGGQLVMSTATMCFMQWCSFLPLIMWGPQLLAGINWPGQHMSQGACVEAFRAPTALSHDAPCRSCRRRSWRRGTPPRPLA